MLDAVILTSLTVSAVLFTLKKWDVLDWYSVYRKAWMPEASCYFCLSFWLSLVSLKALTDLNFLHYVAGALASAMLSAFVLSVVVQREE